MSFPPELEPHAHPTLDSASDYLGQTRVSDSLESSGSYVFNNLESSESEMYQFNNPRSLEGSSSSLPHKSGPMIIDLDGPHTGESSFNAADTQHSNTSAVTSFQFIDVDMDEASGAHSSNEPKRSRGRPKLAGRSAKSKGKQKRALTPDAPSHNDQNNSIKLPHLQDKNAPCGPVSDMHSASSKGYGKRMQVGLIGSLEIS